MTDEVKMVQKAQDLIVIKHHYYTQDDREPMERRTKFENITGYQLNSDYLAITQADKTTVLKADEFFKIEIINKE